MATTTDLQTALNEGGEDAPAPAWPARIYLTRGTDGDGTEIDGEWHDGVTWCAEPIADDDAEYIRADLAAAESAGLKAIAETNGEQYAAAMGALHAKATPPGPLSLEWNRVEDLVFAAIQDVFSNGTTWVVAAQWATRRIVDPSVPAESPSAGRTP